MKKQTIKLPIPLRTILWVVDKQNFKAEPFVINNDETAAKNCLTGEIIKLNNEGLTPAYAKQKMVELDLVHVGKIDALTNYLTCGVSLSKYAQTYYNAVKSAEEESKLDKLALAKSVFMNKTVDSLELSRIKQDLSLGIQRMHYKTTNLYFENKILKTLEESAKNF